MRLPTSKVFRAFPELDAFSDEQCQGFVRLAMREHTASMGGTGLLAALAAILTMAVGFYTVMVIGDAILPHRRYELLIFGVAIAGSTLAAGLVGLKIRDMWLRRVINTGIKAARCPACSYSLLGLFVVDGEVLCPECGLSLPIAERGLTPDMLIAPRGDAPPNVPPPLPPVRSA